jgi:hypothetical protein
MRDELDCPGKVTDVAVESTEGQLPSAAKSCIVGVVDALWVGTV